MTVEPVDEAAVRRMISEQGVGVWQDIFRRVKRVEAKAKELCPVDTGRLRASISGEVEVRDGIPVGVVGSDVEYAPYVFNGTRYMAARPVLQQALDAAR